MQLTTSEKKRLKRAERIANLASIWVYLLIAMLVISVGMTLATLLQPSFPNQKMWFRTWLLISALISMVLKHQRDTRFLVHVIQKIQE